MKASSKEPMNFAHLVKACRTDQERAELSLILAHAVVGLAATVEQDRTGVPMRAMLGCREAARQLVEKVLSSGETEH